MLAHPRVGASGQQPRSCGLGCLEETFSQTPLDPWLEVEVGLATRHRDEEFGLVEAPSSQQEVEHTVGFGVVRQTQVLSLVGTRPPKVDAAEGVG